MSSSNEALLERHETEPQTVSYEEYREHCDENSGSYRQVGILSEFEYNRAIKDPHTVLIDLADGIRAPLLVPLDYIEGYDVPRTRQLTGTNEVYLLALPPALLEDEEVDIADHFEHIGDGAVLVETAHENTQDAKEYMLQNVLPHWQVEEFIDRQIEDDKEAAMGLFSVCFEPKREIAEGEKPLTMKEAIATELTLSVLHGETDPVQVVEATVFREFPQLEDMLWELCERRFQWLGEDHPVSMEDKHSLFKEKLYEDSTYTEVRFEKTGEYDALRPGCFAFLSDGIKHVDQLSSDLKEAIDRHSGQSQENILFFHGIVSDASGLGYSEEIMKMASRLVNRMGRRTRVLYESTNRSWQYIPRLVEEYAEKSGVISQVEPTQKIAQQDYWFLRGKAE